MLEKIIIIIIISVIMVAFGLIVDLYPAISMSATAKIVIYGTPMILLFINMILQVRKCNDKQQKQEIKKKMLIMIFIIYIIALFTLLFLGNEYRQAYTWKEKISIFSKQYFETSTNIVPFRTITDYFERLINGGISPQLIVVNILGNLIAFSPFGFFIPMLFSHKIKNAGQFTLLMVGITLLVEITQYLTKTGAFDIDDVILNTLGAVIVYLLMKTRIVKKLLDLI